MRKISFFVSSISLICFLLCGCAHRSTVINQTSSADPFADDYTGEISGNRLITPLDVPSAIFVTAIEDFRSDYLLGVDITSLAFAANRDRLFFGENALEQDIFRTLKENGVNAVRICIGSDPSGENDRFTQTDFDYALLLGERATDYGMDVLVDFRYRDFTTFRSLSGTDWNSLNIQQKEQVIYDYTIEALHAFEEHNIHVTAVQITCDEENGIGGLLGFNLLKLLLHKACEAIHDIEAENGRDYLLALSLPARDDLSSYVQKIEAADIDFDILATSFDSNYTSDDYKHTLSEIATTYGLQISLYDLSYTRSVQFQANYIRDAAACLSSYGEMGYGIYYGNVLEFFNLSGYPLPSLSVFRYLISGAEAPIMPEMLMDSELTLTLGEELILPETALLVYNDGHAVEVPISYASEEELSELISSGPGTYLLTGRLDLEHESFLCHLTLILQEAEDAN